MDLMQIKDIICYRYCLCKEEAPAVPFIADPLRYSCKPCNKCGIKCILQEYRGVELPPAQFFAEPELSADALKAFVIKDDIIDVRTLFEYLRDPGFYKQAYVSIREGTSDSSDSRDREYSIADPVYSPY